MTEQQIPAGMKPWAGSDGAPEDWDGGEVLRRVSRVRPGYRLSTVGNADWWKRHEVRGRRHLTDIIAYTPKTPASPPSVPVAGEALTQARRIAADAGLKGIAPSSAGTATQDKTGDGHHG